MSQGWKQMDYKTHLHNVVMVFAYPLALLYTWDISPSHKPSFFTSLLHFHPRPSTPNPIHLQHRGWIILFSSMVTNDPISTSVSAPCVNLDLKRCWNHKGDFGHASQVLQAHEDLWRGAGVFLHVLHAGIKSFNLLKGFSLLKKLLCFKPYILGWNRLGRNPTLFSFRGILTCTPT